MLSKFLDADIRIMTTYCVYVELRKLGSEFRPAAADAKKLEKRRCKHENAIQAAECIKEIIGESNKFNYAVATQDAELRAHLRKIRGVPLLYINKSVLILEPPSHATLEFIKKVKLQFGISSGVLTFIKNEVKKVLPKPSEIVVSRSKEAELLAMPVRKRKRAKEPNPLSVKKKK